MNNSPAHPKPFLKFIYPVENFVTELGSLIIKRLNSLIHKHRKKYYLIVVQVKRDRWPPVVDIIKPHFVADNFIYSSYFPQPN